MTILISFEGQDGSGKTTLIAGISGVLGGAGIPHTILSEFSSLETGELLERCLAMDKFLRPTSGHVGVRARTLEVLADLYTFDELVIPHALLSGVVLKDRHVDTFVACQGAMLEREGHLERDVAEDWLRESVKLLRHRPHTTVYLRVPLEERVARLRATRRTLDEHRANEISQDDVEVFALRDLWFERQVRLEPTRFVILEDRRLGVDGMLDLAVTKLRQRLPDIFF